MTTKIVLSGLCAFILVASVGCSSTKTSAKPATTKSSTDAKTAQNEQADPNLPAVGEGPTTTPGHAWGNNISPYFN